MKKIICWLMILLLLPISTFAQIEDKPYIAVLDLEVKKGVPQEASALLSDRLRLELLKTDKFKVVDRENMDVILKEQGFQLADCTTSECIVKIGQLLGVEKMVTGKIGKLGETYYISVAMTNVETGVVEGMADEEYTGEIGQLFKVMSRVAWRLAGGKVVVAKKDTGTLQITSVPQGATIMLDGKEVGTAPMKLANIKVGEHKIVLSFKNYQEYRKDIRISPGETLKVEASLRRIKRSGNLSLSCSEIGAKVFLDKKFIGSTPLKTLKDIKEGEHTLRVTKEGYSDWARKVTIKPDRIISAKATLLPIKVEPAEEVKEGKPWYKKWWVWALVAGAVGGGTAAAVIAAGGDDSGEESNTGSATVRW